MELTGYLGSFPHLAGSVYAFEGNEAQATTQADRASRHEGWGDFETMTDCSPRRYPVYPAIAARGALPPGGLFIDAGGSWVSGTSLRTTRRGARSSINTSSSGSASATVCSNGETSGPDGA